MNAFSARLRHSGQIFIVMMVFAAGYVLGTQTQPSVAQSAYVQAVDSEEFDVFWEVYHAIQDEFVPPDGEPVAIETLVDGAVEGMIDSLEDPNSAYMTAEQYPVFFEDLSGAIEGIGVVIRSNEESGGIEIVNVLEGTPAAKAGIKVGDVFAAVDGEDVLEDNQLELAIKVRGPSGTTVNITVLRDGERIDFSLVRARIDVPNIEYKRIEDSNIGYIKLNQFTSLARTEIDNAIADMDANTLDGLILDFRGNPGGLLSSAIDVTSAFMEDGTILIEDMGDDQEEVFDTNGSYKGLTIPLVVLVDEQSASASELVAGALQDSGAATIIGETSFGKGTVQIIRPLVNGGGLRLTVARWLTPNRSWIHGQGITPDIIVEWEPESFDDPDDPQLQAAIDHLQSLESAALE